MNWILHTLRNSFVYTGRARRAEYGWFFLFGLLIVFTLWLLTWATEILKLNVLSALLDGFGIFFDYLLLIPSLSVTARRLHDLGHSGWWQLVFAPLLLLDLILWTTVGGISDEHIEQFSEIYPAVMIGVGLCSIASLCLTLLLLFRDGEKNANKYGVSPKYQDSQEATVQTI